MPQVTPDDPRWLLAAPDVQPVDLVVLRQVGVPEAIIWLAVRRAKPNHGVGGIACTMGGTAGDLSFLDEAIEDPDERPYMWDLPEGEK